MYKRMGNLSAYINEQDIYMHMPGQKAKIASIKDNSSMVDIMKREKDITQEEFESSMILNDSWDHFYKAMYLSSIGKSA